MKAKKRAYVSVYNKERIVDFCQYLVEYGYEIVATEGTCKVLREAGIAALSAHDLTGYPEPLGGKVRAMHPAIYTGIIANELSDEQLRELDASGAQIFPIELVVINLYPFREDMEEGVPFEEAASHIDVGGSALLNAAARNFMHTVAVCDPDDYDRVLCDLAAGVIAEDERKYLMYKAFAYTASYDALVAQYLSYSLKIAFPKTLTVTYEKTQDMLYGENPHQRAAVYREPLLKEGSIARAKQLAGADLTYSNIHDANAALELIKRGHRLVTDDVVEIRKVSDETLVGSAPDITKHFIELRGIGIVDVRSMFGVQSVRETQNIDLVITLEDWSRDKEYDRLGLEEEYTEFLGNKVVCHRIPIRPGRNLAIITESAAVNHRQKQMGYNAAQELYKRVQENLAKRNK